MLDDWIAAAKKVVLHLGCWLLAFFRGGQTVLHRDMGPERIDIYHFPFLFLP